MKSLVFGNEEETVNENEVASEDKLTNIEYVDKFFDILKDNFQPDCQLVEQLKEWANESLFLYMPFTSRSKFSGNSGTLRKCLTVIDYASALNTAWDMQIDRKDLLTLIIIKYLSISGVKAQPKMIQKQGKGVNIQKTTWHNNAKYEYSSGMVATIFSSLFVYRIPVSSEVTNAIADYVCSKQGNKLVFLMDSSENYVDKFLK